MGSIYLDYAATAPLSEEAISVMRDVLEDDDCLNRSQANPNSLHTPGRNAFARLEEAREQIAKDLFVRPDEVVFTGSATEADNAALFGLSQARSATSKALPHIVTSSIEHDAVRKSAHALETMGLGRVSYVKPTRSGHIDPDAVREALTEDTVLVSVMAANNETGAVNDIAAIADIAHGAGALFHTDAVQALGKIPLDLKGQRVDAASFSAHKIGGPKGVGMLYLKAGTPFTPHILGGGQESGRRSGTQNTLGIAAFAAVVHKACDSEFIAEEYKRLVSMRDQLYAELLSIEGVHASIPCDAGSDRYLPGIVNIYVDGMESETLILQLDLAGIAVSAGSACSSRSLEPSATLLQTGLSRDQAASSLRISFGRYTQQSEIDECIRALKDIAS